MKKYLAILIVICIILSGCKLQQDFVKKEIKKANYCDSEKDCIDIGSSCPFGCNILVNKKEVKNIKRLIKLTKDKCEILCSPYNEIYCENNTCRTRHVISE